MERLQHNRTRSRMVAVVDRCSIGWGGFNQRRMVVFPDALVVVRSSNPHLADEMSRRQEEARSGKRRDKTRDLTPGALARTEKDSRLIPANTLARSGLWAGRRNARLDITTLGGKRLNLRWNWNGNADPEIVLDCLLDVFGNRLVVHRQEALRRPRTAPQVPVTPVARKAPAPGRRLVAPGNESEAEVAAAALRQMAAPNKKQASTLLSSTLTTTTQLDTQALLRAPTPGVSLNTNAPVPVATSSVLDTETQVAKEVGFSAAAQVPNAPHLDTRARMPEVGSGIPDSGSAAGGSASSSPAAGDPSPAASPSPEPTEVQTLLKYLS
jgi:hypothetical protein